MVGCGVFSQPRLAEKNKRLLHLPRPNVVAAARVLVQESDFLPGQHRLVSLCPPALGQNALQAKNTCALPRVSRYADFWFSPEVALKNNLAGGLESVRGLRIPGRAVGCSGRRLRPICSAEVGFRRLPARARILRIADCDQVQYFQKASWRLECL